MSCQFTKLLTLVAAICSVFCFTASAADQPNIAFIMADDLGNADVGYHGGQVKTPNIDKLVAEGVLLESFYGTLPLKARIRSRKN